MQSNKPIFVARREKKNNFSLFIIAKKKKFLFIL
jgi:hypothetical protein